MYFEGFIPQFEMKMRTGCFFARIANQRNGFTTFHRISLFLQ